MRTELGNDLSSGEYDPEKPNCTHEISIGFAGISYNNGFLVVGNTDENCQIGGRGGWFGDMSTQFNSWESVQDWCNQGDTCKTFRNNNGLLVAHKHVNEEDFFGTVIQHADYYALFHKDDEFEGVIISNERFIMWEIGAFEEETRTIVDSIEFID